MKKIGTNSGFTLIEMMVTVSIIMLLAAINIGVYFAYKNRSDINWAANQVKDALTNMQNMALGPDFNNVTKIASHYIFYLNVSPNEYKTPYFRLSGAGPGGISCQSLEPNGGYCIVRVTDKDRSLNPTIAIKSCFTSSYCSAQERYAVSRGKIDVGNAQLSADPLSPLVSADQTGCSAGDCGVAPNCQSIYDGYECNRYNENSLFKMHFRTYDGMAGNNGVYWDVNAASPPENGIISIEKDGAKRAVTINLYTGAISIHQ